ncbi:hypothetical protein MUP79_06455 [Candidatus Bathyarchaeota archaeon]|nr:hypothetical protein [Candidatus Bathyarchaeota archaeon]
MTTRKGLGKGMGCGYKNLAVQDPMVHRQSAKGIKQPQQLSLPQFNINNPTQQKLNETQTDNIKAYNRFTNADFKGYRMPTETLTQDEDVHSSGSGTFDRATGKNTSWIPSETEEQAYQNHKTSGLDYGWFDDLIWNPNAKFDKTTGYVKFKKVTKPFTQFMRDVVEGKVMLKNGLVLSENQARKEAAKYSDYYNKKHRCSNPDFPNKKYCSFPDAKYKRGLAIKVSGDYDEKRLGKRHNEWAVVTKVIDPYHFEVKFEGAGKATIRDTDVKWWVGDGKNDYDGLGMVRQKSEVLPLIKKAMR